MLLRHLLMEAERAGMAYRRIHNEGDFIKNSFSYGPDILGFQEVHAVVKRRLRRKGKNYHVAGHLIQKREVKKCQHEKPKASMDISARETISRMSVASAAGENCPKGREASRNERVQSAPSVERPASAASGEGASE